MRLTRVGEHVVILADGQAFLESGARLEVGRRSGQPGPILAAITSSSGADVAYVDLEDPGSVIAYASTDGGKSWASGQRQTLTGVEAIGDIGVAQVGNRLAILVVVPTSTAFSSGLVATAPRGSGPWVVAPAPVGGSISSAGGRFWITGGVMGDQVFVSTNGSVWRPVKITGVPGYWTAAPAAAVDGLGVVIAATSHNPGGPSEITFLGTPDFGKAWDRLASASAPPTEFATTIPTSITSDGHWIAIWPDGSKVLSGSLGATDHTTISPNGLPANVGNVVFSSATSGVAASQVASCPSGKASCTSTIVVSRTADGGQTWAPVRVSN